MLAIDGVETVGKEFATLIILMPLSQSTRYVLIDKL